MDTLSIALFLLVGIIEIVSVWLVNRRLSYEHDFMVERGTVGEQFGEWLLETETDDEDSQTRLEALSAMVGKTMFKTQRFSEMQMKSVDVKHFNAIDQKVFDAMQNKNPEFKIVARVLEELGLGDLVNEKDLPYVVEKYGAQFGLGQPSKVNGSKHWKLV